MDANQLAATLDRLLKEGNLAELENASRAALAGHRFYLWHMYLIVVLLRTGRRDEAARELDDVFSYKFNIGERAWPEIKAAFPEKFAQHYVLDTMKPNLSLEFEAHVHVRRRWNVACPIADTRAFEKAVDELISESVPTLPVLESPQTPVTTFGSCFAANLARALKGVGVDATSLLIEESINSPLANRAFLHGLVDPTSEHGPKVRAAYGAEFLERAKARLAAARAIVMTLGVAPSFFHRDSGRLAFLEDYRPLLASGAVHMRTPSVAETRPVIGDVLGLVRRLNAQARIYVSISPVPLMGTVEMSSALMADCVSKTTLRAALHEVLQGDSPPDVYYWPSFEIVRWLGGHTTLPVFGADDNVSRHVSNWLVDMIVERFSWHLFGRRAATTSVGFQTTIDSKRSSRWS